MKPVTMTVNVGAVTELQRPTEAQYDYARERLRSWYGNSSNEAAAKSEQALARLSNQAHQGGWTREELAKKEGKPKSQIDRLLHFGRFLAFVPMSINAEALRVDLSERRFRGYWERTSGTNERQRFASVLKLMKKEAV